MNFREKLVRLRHENKILRLNQRGPDEDKLSMVQALLDESYRNMNQLRMENRLEIMCYIIHISLI